MANEIIERADRAQSQYGGQSHGTILGGVRTGVLAALPPDRSNAERLSRRPDRFGCQALLSEKSILAAMAYVDLNPVRAKIAGNIATSRYTSVKIRYQQLRKNPERANQPIVPLVGVRSFNLPGISASSFGCVRKSGSA